MHGIMNPGVKIRQKMKANRSMNDEYEWFKGMSVLPY